MANIVMEVKNLYSGYKDKNILENINLEIEKGKIYSIIGSNGCGKTTLMRTLSRNKKPKSGKVLIDGKDIFSMSTKEVARKIAVLSQNNITMSDVTVESLVGYGRYAYNKWWQNNTEKDKEIVKWAIEKTGLNGYEERKLQTLSGGERQRAWIAMAIAQKPEILLLDEPTTYLDISHQLGIMELVKKLNKEEGITIIMVLHDINHASRYSDELIIIDDHKVYEKGDPWRLINDNVLQKVFKVEADILEDSDNNKPIFYAKKVVE